MKDNRKCKQRVNTLFTVLMIVTLKESAGVKVKKYTETKD